MRLKAVRFAIIRRMKSDTRLDTIDAALMQRIRAAAKASDQFFALHTVLITRNPNLTNDELTGSEAQRAITSIAILDGQIQNGGLLQFFWNYGYLAQSVSPALRLIGFPTLADKFDKAADQLAENAAEFLEHREGDSVDDFADAAEEVDFTWFEREYFGEFDRTADRWSGLVEQLYQHSTSYMLDNLDAFVRLTK